jgi:drug/metabolite transporter (DMT)-like permease
MTERHPEARLISLSFAAVYLIWGTSFAVTKVMVLSTPPFLAGALRFLFAGTVLFAVTRWRALALPRDIGEWRHVAVMAVLQVAGSAGLNIVAAQHIASNQAALLNASGSLWIPLLGALGPRGDAISRRVGVGLAIGFMGVALLLWPRDGYALDTLPWQGVVIVACLNWSIGTIYYRRNPVATPMPVILALAMLCGALMLGSVGLLAGEWPRLTFHISSVLAISYLALLNSCLAYSAYVFLMRRTTPARLATYGYVNPAIAAMTGWVLLGEQLSALQLIGMAVILAAVVAVTLPERHSR